MSPNARFITSEISQIGGPDLTDANDAAIYLVHFANQAVLIDAGCGHATDRLLMNLAAAGVVPGQIQYLLLTHCHYDHTGGAAELRRRFGWRVAMHTLDADYLESGDPRVTAASWYGDDLDACPVDVRLSDGDRLALGDRSIAVIHIPGHSPGSLAYLVESEGRRVLFAQDVHGPLHAMLLSNRSDYQASLRKLKSLAADILCEGHHGVFVGKTEIAAFIDRFVED
jgi:glyoxylase-like metal-dependent hydrolase (beta-lactamase superfamily II)